MHQHNVIDKKRVNDITALEGKSQFLTVGSRVVLFKCHCLNV